MEFQKYFQSYHDYFWEWELENTSKTETHKTICIPNGQTIVYEKKLMEILQAIAIDGLPPLGSLLLVLIATNSDGNNAINSVMNLAKNWVKTDTFLTQNNQKLASTFDFMRMLASLPENYKTGNNRIHLLQLLFQDCHNAISVNRAKRILQIASNGLQTKETKAFAYSPFEKDFRTLGLLKEKFPTVDAIIDSLQNLPVQAIEEQTKTDLLEQNSLLNNNWIENLISHDQTFQVGSLIQRIWSGLGAQFHHSQPSQQPLGGVSDLSNKGDFDKLILSEFANDDDLLMMRLAHNEALYFQREIPPESNTMTRIILIDSSLKNWGNCKNLAFATALAIAKHPKNKCKALLFVLGKDYNQVQYESIQQLGAGLNILNGTLDCTAGLQDFLSTHNCNNKDFELFFITSQESLQLTAMQKAMSDHYHSLKYIVTTQFEGQICLYQNHKNGKKLLQQLQLPLEELWVKKKNNLFVPVEIVMDTPITVAQSPILFHIHPLNNLLFKLGQEDWFVLSPENNFFRNNTVRNKPNSSYKFELLFENVQTSNSICCLAKSGNEYYLLDYEVIQQQFVLYNLSIQSSQTIDYQLTDTSFDWNNLYFKTNSHNNYFYIYDNQKVTLLEYETGELKLTKANISVERFLKLKTDERNAQIEFKKNWPDLNILKKISRIYINTQGDLVINSFVLTVTEFALIDSTITLIKQGKRISRVKSIFRDNQYLFRDGSTISHNKSGMLVLKSSNTSLPTIYIPPLLYSPLAMATATDFTGNVDFLPANHSLEIIAVKDFIEKNLRPFIKNILDYGA